MELIKLNLQFFAEGAAPAASAVSAPATPGETVAEAPAAQDREAEFERMIKGDYKDLYDKRVSDTVQKRLKSTKETVDKYNKLLPTLDTLGHKYGVSADDIDALNKAIEDDDTYYEEEAFEKGVTVAQLKEIRKIERENAALRTQMREQQQRENADRIYADWMEQAERAKVKFPALDLRNELQNDAFTSLLKAGVDVESAYTVVHKDELIPAAMRFAEQKGAERVTNRVTANKSRPVEGGVSQTIPGATHTDVKSMTKQQRDEIIAAVRRGERVVL